MRDGTEVYLVGKQDGFKLRGADDFNIIAGGGEGRMLRVTMQRRKNVANSGSVECRVLETFQDIVGANAE